MPKKKEDVSNLESVLQSYGGFHDLDTFRSETGITTEEASDLQALQLINEDMREQKRIADLERNTLELKAREADNLRQARDSYSAQKSVLESNLEAEKMKRKMYEGLDPYMPIVLNRYKVVDPYDSYNSYSSYNSNNRYLEKERIKNELKQEILNEKKRLADERRWKNEIENFGRTSPTRSKSTRSKSKSKTKSKSKSKKSKSKSKKK
jgi:hypothetical protein